MLFPKEITKFIDGKSLEPNKIGCSGASVYKIGSTPGMYLKIAETSKDTSELAYESNLLAWLEGKLPVPRVIASAAEDGKYFMLISEIEGVPAHEALHIDKSNCITLLAKGLRRIHSIDISSCPFDRRLDEKLRLAELNVRSGAVDEDDFDDDTKGMTAEEVYDKLLSSRPMSEDLVFTHGDYCLPNIIVKDGHISGFIDMGRGGAADRYQDIALALRSLKYNLSCFGDKCWSEDYDRIFFEAYGIGADGFDPDKAAYYRLLDELF